MMDSSFPPPEDEQHGPGPSLARKLQRRAWKVSALILQSDLPWIDIEIEINKMRQLVEEECPERLDAFERIYAARFERLRQQWREVDSEL